MQVKLAFMVLCGLLLTACMSTSPALGPNANAWANYSYWYKVTPEPTTGDPTGRLAGVHDGINAYRNIYINNIGEAVNRGTQSFPYPAGTILVKESFNNRAALDARRSPDLTIMVKLAQGQSPQTADWEYVMGEDGSRRGTGDSGLGQFCFGCHVYAAATDFNFFNSVFYQNNR